MVDDGFRGDKIRERGMIMIGAVKEVSGRGCQRSEGNRSEVSTAMHQRCLRGM